MSVFVCAGVVKDADGAQKGDAAAQNPGHPSLGCKPA